MMRRLIEKVVLTALQLQTGDQLSQLRSSHVRLQLWLINEQDAEKVFLSTYKQTTEQRAEQQEKL